MWFGLSLCNGFGVLSHFLFYFDSYVLHVWFCFTLPVFVVLVFVLFYPLLVFNVCLCAFVFPRFGVFCFLDVGSIRFHYCILELLSEPMTPSSSVGYFDCLYI